MRGGTLLLPRIAFRDPPPSTSLRDELARIQALPVGTRGSVPLKELDPRPILLPSSISPDGFRRFSIFEKNDTGIRYVSGFLEITDEPLTRHIERRLKWFSEWSKSGDHLDPLPNAIAEHELRK